MQRSGRRWNVRVFHWTRFKGKQTLGLATKAAVRVAMRPIKGLDMAFTIADIAAALGARAVGDTALVVSGASDPAGAGPDHLAIALTPRFMADLSKGQAKAALLPMESDWQAHGLCAAILTPHSRLAMSGATRTLDPGQGYGHGIDPSAVIAADATLAEQVSIGAHCVIGAGTHIGAKSAIGPGCYIGPGVTLGVGAVLHAHVRIGARVQIGTGFIAQPGATIGFDGHSFTTAAVNHVESSRATLGDPTHGTPQPWEKIHSLGSVIIGDDVELGANTCVDSGTLRPTRIGTGTKIDNLCQIAHNVVIGDHCLFAAMVGIAGSSVIGNHVVLAGQVGVTDHIQLGDNVIAGGASVILSRVPAGRVVLGYPAMAMDRQLASYKALRRLPRWMREWTGRQKSVCKPPKND